MPRPALLPLALLVVLAHLLPAPPRAHAARITQQWTVSLKPVSPDGVRKLVPVVNGRYPGPTLRARVGDVVAVTVRNALPSDTTSIHWHGVKQTATPWSDGVPGITQCPIGPGESFTYEFVLDAPGTLWWHSHTAFQKSSLYGAIIVDGDQEELGDYPEITLLLNDWYHASGDEQIEGLSRKSDFKWVGDAQSILFNGRGEFNCTTPTLTKQCDPHSPERGPAVFDVLPDTTYRLRIIGASSLSFLNLNIDAHLLKMVEVETTLLKPFWTKFLDIGSGQTYSALLRTKTVAQLKATKNNNGLFWMQLNVRLRKAGERGLAILRYSVNSGESEPRRRIPHPPEREDAEWSLRHARRFFAKKKVELPKPSRVLTVIGNQNRATDGRLLWAMNNVSYSEGGTPLLHAMALGLRRETNKWVQVTNIPTVYDYKLSLSQAGLSEFADEGTHVMRFAKDEVVDFVFQNTVSLSAAPEVHPWHLHLHNFWVLGMGEIDSTWTAADEARYDATRAVSRNTFTLLPGSWTAVRVRFDNAGTAHFHCHILAHLFMGMGFVAQVGDAADVPPPPPGTQFCGTVTKLSAPPVRNPLVSGGCPAAA